MKVVVFSAHPDDVEFGMGATIHKMSGVHDVTVIISFYFSDERQLETYDSLSILGVKKSNILFTHSTDIRSLVKEYDNILSNITPSYVFTHFYGDSHQEHKLVYSAAVSSLRKYPSVTCMLWENNQPGALTHDKFAGNVYISVSKENVDNKIKSLNKHTTQMSKYETGRLFTFLDDKAHINGYLCGHEFAEVFYSFKLVMNTL